MSECPRCTRPLLREVRPPSSADTAIAPEMPPSSSRGPGNATLFYVLYLYNNAFKWFKMGYASAMAYILFVIVLAITAAQIVSQRRWVFYS